MEGSGDSENNYGVIQRSMDKLFQVQAKMKAHGWNFENNASQLEIYNEAINDLLAQDSNGRSVVRSFNKNNIKHVGTSETHIENLSIHSVNQVSDVLNLLTLATSCRSVASTKMNEKSSRSHSVFMLRVSATHLKSGQVRHGKLVLIDLAGSEKIDKSGVQGEQLKEANAINVSLSSLSNVIQALSKKQKHVPFRDSTLTYLLQNCLGGDSKCLMMVNVSPLIDHATETISSLRFAQKVNACVVGVAKKQGENKK
jgi:kinesin family member C1